MAADFSHEPFPTPAQLVDRVPLIKNPGFWVPKPVQLPPDIHPLPDDVQAYFVYPHTLEAHVLQTLPPALAQLQAEQQQRLALLASYAESKERARRAELNRLAPGWHEGKGGVMQPLRAGSSSSAVAAATTKHGDEHDLLHEEEEGATAAGGGVSGGHDNNTKKHANAEQATLTSSSNTAATAASPAPDLFKDFVEGLERLDSTLGSNGSARSRDVDDLI
ncbi:hypothetical protein C6P46_005748 [Rhodotorula mucilaginosa]|uniref:Uncharacterized protein n=1 Tax=Rhodotorula mucilaginosa TaxID=5537 RepID=A0A9P6VZL8_RHOMI|nr:hypothetical protein C6P46_005748 [Rhodotorula mucilaginosa]